MALINCPECGKSVSDTAETCPRCGYIIGKYVSDPDERMRVRNEKKIQRIGYILGMLILWVIVSIIISINSETFSFFEVLIGFPIIFGICKIFLSASE